MTFTDPVPAQSWERIRAQSIREPDEAAEGKAHADAGDTERKAARETRPRSGTARARVLMSLDGQPQTDDELQRRLAMNPNTQRPRRVELVEGGWVRDSGERRDTRWGSDAIVWEPTGKGRLWCANERLERQER